MDRVFEETGDTSFVKEMYPQLLNYYRWWYIDRDHNSNGICEFGSVDGTLEAAAWESGMDNAIRFDDARMVKNSDTAWSFDLFVSATRQRCSDSISGYILCRSSHSCQQIH